MLKKITISSALFFFSAALALQASPFPYSVKVVVSEQALYLYKGGEIVKTYPVSTSKYGTGNRLGSGKTPLGTHKVERKIGAEAPLYTIFRNRVNTKQLVAPNFSPRPSGKDFVTTRILWLRGLEPGVNKGGRIDSFRRCIYIHGTPDEGLIGSPASHGCIRMKNKDVAELFDAVPVGALVEILP